MNRKFEDEILRLAFEEMTPEQASQLEQTALRDPEAARALADYREMRASLRSLADIPADQLSKERLRTAILTRGLERKRASKLGWAWMPVMAACLASVVFMVRPRHTPPPQMAMRHDANLLTVPTITVPPSTVALNNAAEKMTRPAPININVQPIIEPRLVAANFTRPVRHHKHLVIDPRLVANIDLFNNSTEPITLPTSPAMTSPEGAGKVASASSETPPIVLIDGEKDANTGASRAKEVDSSNNVVVGG